MQKQHFHLLQVSCCKHYTSMYLDEYLKKNIGFLQKKKTPQKYPWNT